MNQNRYRLVFNKQRGMLMAVAECANGTHKAASGERAGSAGRAAWATLRPMAWAMLVSLGVVQLATAQIVSDPRAGHGPGVTAAPNGTPLVNIQAPSAAGVSHNQYQQFSVDGRGAILNNATSITQTQLGGYVPGNANLGASGPARVILNEVTGTAPSQLNGYIEIAGQRADVIISNVNGLSLNGVGFLNVNRATLTTGTPVFGGDGSLAAFRVTRGGIQVEGQGFNGTNLDQVDLIARSVTVNANLWANQANVIAGANQVDYASLGVQVIQGEGTAPTVGIDVSNLGGMYANRIRLLGTEAGVGVRSAGTLAAQAGDFSIDSAGRVTLAGSTSATGNLAMHGAHGIDSLGTTAAGANLSATSAGDIQNAGALIAGHDLAVAGQSVQSSGTLAAGIDANGNMTQAGNLSVAGAQGVSATGQNLAGSNVTLSGSSVSLAGSQTRAAGAMALTAQACALDLANATVTAGQGLTTNAAGLLRSDGAKVSAAWIDAGAQQLSNRGGMLYAQNGATLGIRGNADNTGGQMLTEAGDLTLSADGQLSNAGGRVTNAGGGLAAIRAQRIENAGNGVIGGNGAATVTADQLINTGGAQLIAGTDLGLHLTQSADNSGGHIYAGQRLTVAGSQVAWRNDGGTISGKAVQFAGASLSNRQGTILADEDLSAALGGNVDNTSGVLQGGTALDVSSAGTLTNDAGQIVNTGTGKTRVAASSLRNTNSAMVGGNGDVQVQAQQLANTTGAQMVSGGAQVLDVGQSFNNAGGQVYGGTGLAINGAAAALNNDGGSVASGGNSAVQVASLSNQGGKVVADGDIGIDTGAFTGVGTVHSGRDLRLAMQGDYTNVAGNLLKAEHNFTFGTTGVFTNQGRLEAVNALTLNGSRIVNAAGATINSAATTLNASADIANAGRIEGDTLTTNSDTLSNTGTLIGDTVTANAREIRNTGAAAIMAATDTLNVYGRELVTNTDGATYYSLGDLNIAANGERDARGYLRNRTGRVLNDRSTIEGGSDYSVVEIAAQELINQRPDPVIVSDTTVETKHQLKREKYIHCHTTNPYEQMGCTQALWEGPYKTPIDATFTAAQILSRDDGKQRLVVDINGVATPIDYNTLSESNGVLQVNYWDGYDRDIHYDPGTEYETRNDAQRGWQRVEIARDTTTTTTTERDANPNQPSANLVSGGAMILANVGSLTNRYSTIAAGGSMQIGDQSTTSGTLDSGQFGNTTVTNIGQTLYQRTTQDIVSTYAWSKDTTQDVGPVVQPSVVMPPVVVGKVAGNITAGQRLAIFGGDIHNEDVGKGDPMAGTGSTTVTGTQVSAHGVNAVTLANAPLSLPSNGLYKYHTEPGYSYLIETDPRFTQYGNFLSSDYMLGLLGIDPAMTHKRLGDGFYEQKLIRDQVTRLTGRVTLAGYDSAEEQYKALMASGVHAAQQFNILPGMALTAAQMDALTSDIVWLVSETVTLPDGSTQSVLVPRIYLARAHAADLQANGALIAADDLELHSAGTMHNSGIVDARGRLSIAARGDVVNRGGAIRSQGTTAISAGRDILNQSGQIIGDKVGLVAGRDIQNVTLFDQRGTQTAAGNSKASTSLYGQQAGITSTGDMLLSAGRDLTATGSTIHAGGDAAVLAGRNLTFDALEGKTSQSVYNSDKHHSEGSRTEHAVSTVQTGGSLTTSSGGDTTLKGTQAKAGTDLTMVAGGDLNASAVTNETTHDNVARQSRQRQQEDHRRDQSIVGVNLEAGGNATLAAVKPASQGGGLDRTDGKGNVSLIGANVMAGTNGQGGRTLNVVADRDVTVAEARELHDSSVDIQRKSGSFVSRNSTSEQSSRHSDIGVGSTLSGDNVRVKGGNDVTIRQSAIAATDGVALSATRGDVLATAGQNSREASDALQVKKSGISGFAGQGGIGVSVGKSEASGASHSLAITQSDARSVVGASNGNVVITAGKDAAIIGSDLIAGSKGDKDKPSAGNIDILAQNVTIAEGVDRVYQDASQRNRSSGLSVALVGTPYDTAKNLQAVQQDPSTVSRVTGTVKELGASALTLPQVAVRIGNQKSNAQGSSVTTTSSGSSVTGAGNVRVRATGNGQTDADGRALDGNILVSGSTISAGDAAMLDAARDVAVRASTDTYQASNSASSSGWTVSSALPSPGDVARHLGGGPNNSGVGMVPFGSQTSNASGATTSSKQNASVITGNTVGVKARTGDVTIAGSGIAAEGDVALSAAKGKIDILSGQDTLSQRSDRTSRQIGDLGGTGYSGTVGVHSESHHTDANQTTQNTIRSQVVSKSGNVTMSAGENLTARGADIAAGNDVTMIGKNVTLDPGTDSASQTERHRASQYGTTLALSGYTVTAAQALENAARAVEDKKDGRVATLYGVQAGLAIANGIQGIQTVTSGGVSQTAAIKVTASIGGGSQQSEAHSTSSTHQGTTVKAGNAVTVVATGSAQKDAEGFAIDGDISGRGVQIEGKTVTLSAARDVTLESAQDRASLDSRSSGSTASIGVGFGLGGDQNGFTLELAASQNKAKANGEAVTNHNSHVVGTDRVTVVSGRDTNLKGAQLIGDTVAGTVGRDLNIESRPDTETYHRKESSSGMQASICVPPFCYGTTVHASGSVTQGNTDSTYSSVQEQSGIYAGKGGFNVDVKGNTDLKGGILASTADPASNRFKTGTLTTSDIENKAEYSSDSTTLVASYSGGKSVPASDPNLGPVQPAGVNWAGNTNLLQSGASSLATTAAGNAQKSIDGSAAGVTKSAIAPGTVIIANNAGQRALTGKSADKTAAGLNRDTANANQSIDKIFDAQKVKDQRELHQLQSQVAQQLAPMVYDQVGTLTQNQPPEVKVAVHAVIGGLMAQAMGGRFAAGAAGDAAATIAAELVGQQILNNPDLQTLSEQDHKALVQIAGTIVAAGAGAATGGSMQDAAAAGAAGGLGTQYNWAMHPPIAGSSVPPTPGEPQKPGSVPGKPKYDGDESTLTGTPDQSRQNVVQAIVQPALEAIENVGAVVGAILPNPLKPVESLGAIFSADNGRYDVLTNPQAREFAQANGWTTSAPDQVKDAARGSPVFYNPEDGNYYSPDKAGHRADDAWKAFDKKGNRVGTFIWDGNRMTQISK
ncbi:hemagglutinin repeat-containing protein [Cupriavidus oxalaticus]|uniref:Exoprotein, adhesin or hemolysin n=1 Tax=Cupriavidus oxalaticus TaxID=96344 RepID=A0A375FLU7_9BURK|nr:hemagglutinin repeat-containing protein [Cupriavidus oxalaticus]QRQ85616.1 hemagglutinin repeat-containing protein [Cupriavidus oxalaticus]QRQ90296.1 hemagglutinin repeat-containing protein [Cupriavidus oxalaticus]WQD84807.1 hemagglutinin repeat-containing protein [Cupriavidus oxalaticus]SPC07698.1 exoprotein, putative adhesin or hemolysin [Cupriavidus oxalaticus]SPC24470.1 putative Exoprotein, adhesin or hemolysin [Cupriavidus oxalaticus]